MTAPNPYRKLPRRAYWSSSVARAARQGDTIADLWRPAFPITRDDPIMTAGSCFAQHISTALRRQGFSWIEAERPPFGLSDDAARTFGYGIFSARTGNIYTTRMLIQWLEWATDPDAQDRETWQQDGAWFDPLRPQIEPGGFEDEAELFAARRATFEALRNGIRQATVFVFTLGLTEMWENAGRALPIPPAPEPLRAASTLRCIVSATSNIPRSSRTWAASANCCAP